MGIDTLIDVIGIEEDRLLLPSPSHFDPTQSFQIGHQRQQNCTWRDYNILLDSHSQLVQTLSKNIKIGSSNPKSLPQYDDMKYWLLAAFVLIFIRRLVERNIFQPLGKRLGIKDRIRVAVDKIPCRNPGAVPMLENAYSPNKKLTNVQLQSLSKETDLHQREIERWMRRRGAVDKLSVLVKFSESGWRFVAYVASTSIGIISLWGKPWFWDWKQCWSGYPNHELPNEIWWYHLYGGGLYTSFLITQFVDVKRKDFWEMFLHHITTILLLVCFFTLKLTRISTITLLLHDCADIFIELAKMATYAKKADLATVIFVGFTLIWIVTRLVILPVKIVYQGVWLNICDSRILPHHIGYPILGMSLALLGLHLFWTYFICKVALSAIKSGPQNVKDSRSSSEFSDSSADPSVDSQDELQLERFANNSRRLNRKLSLQGDVGEHTESAFLAKQRPVVRRISAEIM